MPQTFKDVVSTSTTYFPTESETINLKKNVKEALKTLSETEIEKKILKGRQTIKWLSKVLFYI